MDYEKEQLAMLRDLGCAVLLAQRIESVFRMVTTFVIQDDAPLNMEKLQRIERKERRKTLGYFCGELKNRVDLEHGFEDLLDEFIEDRNFIVHRFYDVVEWTDTRDGVVQARRFLAGFVHRGKHLLLILVGFVRAWQMQIGMPDFIPEGAGEWFEKIDREFAPLINQLLSDKEQEND